MRSVDRPVHPPRYDIQPGLTPVRNSTAASSSPATSGGACRPVGSSPSGQLAGSRIDTVGGPGDAIHCLKARYHQMNDPADATDSVRTITP